MVVKSRGKQAILNTFSSFVYEIITVVCGLVITRLILSYFGSSYNGITSSITQFISCIALMRAGIGGVTRAALYQPLAEGNQNEINIVIGHTESYMRKIAIIFAIAILFFSCMYPFLVSDEFSWLFSSTLILIISLSTFAQYFFGMTYQMLLDADQKQWITYLINGISLVANAIISVILIHISDSIHVVKLGSSFVFVISSVYLYKYVKKKYNITKCSNLGKDRLQQKWDALAHEVANFFNTNSDVIILTFFSSLATISVYSVYHYVTANLRKIVKNFTVSFGASFGNMKAMGQSDLIESNFKIFEIIVFSVSGIIYSTTLVMITPFALLFTHGVNDVNYNQPLFGYILVLVGVMDSSRIPYETVVKAFGHYKQTRNGAILEVILHVSFSILLTIQLGLLGVAIGGLLAISFRSCQYVYYFSKHVVKRDIFIYIKHLLFTIIIMICSYLMSRLLHNSNLSIFMWVINTAIVLVFATVLTMLKNLLFFRNDSILFYKKIKSYRK